MDLGVTGSSPVSHPWFSLDENCVLLAILRVVARVTHISRGDISEDRRTPRAGCDAEVSVAIHRQRYVYCVSFGVVNVVIKVLDVPAGTTVEGSYCALGTSMAAGCA